MIYLKTGRRSMCWYFLIRMQFLMIKASEKEFKVECWGIDGRKYLETTSSALETVLKTNQLPVGVYFIQAKNSKSEEVIGVEKVLVVR